MKFEIDVDDKFMNRFITGGVSNGDCSCGRQHISMHGMDDWDFDENEQQPDELRASYIEEAAKDDMMVLDYDHDGFEVIELEGNFWIASCECEGWRPAMEFLIRNRLAIAEFLIDTSIEIKRVQKYEDTMDILKGEYKIPQYTDCP